MQRQKCYCQEHKIGRYQLSSQEYPFSSRIACSTCGYTYMQISPNRQEDYDLIWRCSSFNGMWGMIIEDRRFTPKPKALWADSQLQRVIHYREKKRKLPAERQMLCTDIQVLVGKAEQAFLQVYNQLVHQRLRYMASLKWVEEQSEMCCCNTARVSCGNCWVAERRHRFDCVVWLEFLLFPMNQFDN